MGSNKNTASIALFLSLNILFHSLVSSCNNCPGPKPNPNPNNPNPNIPNPIPNPKNTGKCPRDALKLGVCADVLNLVNNVTIGSPPTLPCCSLLQGLVNLEAALCLCIAIKANILGINLNLPISLSLVLNNCGKKLPNGFECT